MPVLGIGTVQDITEQKLSEIVLQEREEWFRALFEGAPDAIFLADPETGIVINANPAAEKLLQKPLRDIIGCHQKDLHPERIDAKAREIFEKHSQEGGPTQPMELLVLQSDGTEVSVEIRAHTFQVQGKPVVMGTFRDLTDWKRMEEKILKSLSEKEILLQEIHHRVKNNMALISALLRLQGRCIDNEFLHRVFQESQNRIQSMALVHEKLYRTQDFTDINFREYVMDLVRHIFQSYGKACGEIALKMEIDEVSLGIDTMIPCGLILNEMVTNSVKHAFDQIPQPEIQIMCKAKEESVHLVYRDNGKGIPEDIDFPSPSSLGLQILDMLTRQLRGTIELKRSPGTEFDISFRFLETRRKR